MLIKMLQDFDFILFNKELLHWYNEKKRDLPWRKDKDPYKVWVSEVMLQQTRVDTVIPYFYRFMRNFPTIQDLANADQQTVLKMWEGLGYYSRARNLHEAAKKVVEKYNGQIPQEIKSLGSLKGIGPYTRGAILSIAFDKPEPAVDGNVMRVLSRILLVEEDITNQKTRRLFEECVKKIIDQDDPSSFNQGLMELGALICIPKSPKCNECPVREFCRAYENDMVTQLPIRKKAKKQKEIQYAALLIRDENGQYMIEKRPNEGLLANLWQFPMIPLDQLKKDNMHAFMQKNYGMTLDIKEKKGELTHLFSHIKWNIDIYEADVTDIQTTKDRQFIFIDYHNMRAYPFPSSHLQIMKYVKEV